MYARHFHGHQFDRACRPVACLTDDPDVVSPEVAFWETERRTRAATDLLQLVFAIGNFPTRHIFGHCQQIAVVHGVGADFKFSTQFANLRGCQHRKAVVEWDVERRGQVVLVQQFGQT